MARAAIYSRVDPKDRGALAEHKAAAEALCRTHDWTFVHYSDSASGSRPPLQFAGSSQLIRPGLTRLLSAVEAGSVDAVVPAAADAFATTSDLTAKLESFLQQQGFRREEIQEAPGYYFVRDKNWGMR